MRLRRIAGDREETEIIPWARPSIGDEELAEVVETFKSGWLSCGPRVERFEEEMSRRAGRKYAVAVSNGTAALDLAVRVVGVRAGDEVIVPALSYLATASVLVIQGAKPVFVDIDPNNLCLDANLLARRITPDTRAVLCTDHGGNPCDFVRLSHVCNKLGIPLILDGAQSIGSMFAGRPTLSYGLVSTTSFHAAKTITTIEGGMLFTDDEQIARRLRIMRSQGEDPHRKYYHVELGHNFRMTEMQGAIGLAQLRKLDELLASRRSLAMRYAAELAPLGLAMPPGLPHAHNSHFLCSLLVPRRDEVAARLKQRGIETRSCYPLPLYHQPIFRHLIAEPCPVSERVAGSILNPPMFHGMTAQQQKRVARELGAALEELAPGREGHEEFKVAV
jgi:dTDP-4-amino-4,6-dideoxygalactose transaminase